MFAEEENVAAGGVVEFPVEVLALEEIAELDDGLLAAFRRNGGGAWLVEAVGFQIGPFVDDEPFRASARISWGTEV